ncbi:MAG: hypothetical protein AB8B48_12370 [Pseudomonadales bacterium]
MNTLFKLSTSLTRLLVRGVLVALLASQFAWADHFHLELEQNAGCSVCIFVDNTPAVPNAEAVQLVSPAYTGYDLAPHSENPLSQPAFNHHSRAPPAH